MVGTIGPVVHGGSTRSLRWVYLLLFVAAHAVGGMLTGFVLALPVATLRPLLARDVGTVAPGLLVLGAFGVARDAGFLRFHVPMSQGQVPRSWSLLPAGVMSVLYGTILGSGVFTRINSSAFYVVAAACVFLGDPALSLALFLLFAVSKALLIVLVAGVHFKLDKKNSNFLVGVACLTRYVPLASAAGLALFSGAIASTFFLIR